MGTPYFEIYDLFLQKINDISIAQKTDSQIEELLEGYLKSAIGKFYLCKKDLSNRDNIVKQFNVDLDDMEKEILANLMVIEWIQPKLYNVSLLRQTMATKDFKIYSQANHIEELINLKNDKIYETDKLIIAYTFKDDIEELGG